MTNQDVIEMVSMGLPDEVVTDKIQASANADFDTSVAGLKALKAAHVSDGVIRSMINFRGGPAEKLGTTNAASNEQPQEAGVYLMSKGNLMEIEPEIVGWQTGGVAKRAVTLGLDKGHINGKVMKPQSDLQVATPVEFVIKTLEGTSVTEFQLLRLYKKGNRREFRAVTGGILHVKGGAERNDLVFIHEKIGNRTWHVRLTDLPNGEYGFLPPGISAESIASSGKMYTFGVIDAARKPGNQDPSGTEVQRAEPGSKTSLNIEEGSIGANWEGNPVDRHNGVTVASVVEGGPAALAGIRAGDVILACGGTFVYSAGDLTKLIRRFKPGDQVAIRWRHFTQTFESSVAVVPLGSD
jgi:hypothetical protein